MSVGLLWGFPGGSVVKNLPAKAGDAGDLGSIPGLGRSPGEGNGNPLQFFCLGNSHGRRSLLDYSPWGYKESDRTERLSSHTCGPPVGLGPYQMLWETPRLKVTIPDPQEIKDLKSY